MARPNFVFILIDDMGWKDLSCCGSSFYETPNLDALHNRGERPRNALVCALASILTISYCHAGPKQSK